MSVDLYFSIKDNATPALKQILDTTEDLTSAFETSTKRVAQYEDQCLDLKTGMVSATKAVRDAKKALEETNNEANQDAFKKALATQEEYKQKISETTKVLKEEQQAHKILASAMEEVGNKQSDMVSKLNNRVSAASGSKRSGSGGTLSTLGKSGAIAAAGNMLAPAMQDLAGSLLSSSMDSTSASYWSEGIGGALSGASAGAAIGSMFAPGIGTAIGAAAGAVFGGITSWISSWSKEQEELNNAYKDVVKGLTDSSFEKSDEMMQTGIALASSREQIKVSFQSLLKNNQEADALYNDVREMSNQTPYTFDQLAGVSRYLAVSFKTSDEIMDWLGVIGDAAASVGASESDMQEMTRALTKIKNTGYASREDLDMWSDRGINVYQALSQDMGISQGEVFKKITKGEVSSDTVFSSIQKYVKAEHGGGAELQADTYAGKLAKLNGLISDKTEGAFGTAYEDAMKPVLEKQIEWYEGEKGKALEQMYAEKGKFQARIETDQIESQLKSQEEAIANYQAITANLPENPFDSLFDSILQKGDQASGVLGNLNSVLGVVQNFTLLGGVFDEFSKNREKAAATLLPTIDIKAEVNYSTTDAFALQNEIKKTVLDYAQMEVRKNPVLYQSEIEVNKQYTEGEKSNKDEFWNEFIKQANSETYTISPTVKVQPKMYLAGNAETQNTQTFSSSENFWGFGRTRAGKAKSSDAYGLSRVPYNNFPALLHEGERVLTARETRLLDRFGGLPGLGELFSNKHASGLTSVPYDNYPALLHQGERVLTAQETRQVDRASGGIQVTITGNTFSVRSEQEKEDFFNWFIEKIKQAALAQA